MYFWFDFDFDVIVTWRFVVFKIFDCSVNFTKGDDCIYFTIFIMCICDIIDPVICVVNIEVYVFEKKKWKSLLYWFPA